MITNLTQLHSRMSYLSFIVDNFFGQGIIFTIEKHIFLIHFGGEIDVDTVVYLFLNS